MFRWRRYLKKIISSGIKIIFLLICFSVPLFVINIYLMGEISVLNAQIDSSENTESMKRLKTMEKSLKETNNAFVKIDKIGKEQISWVGVFGKIVEIIPPNIQIISLQIEPNGALTIVGNAKTREDVLEFGKRLKNSADFSDIQTPLDNLTKSNNIDFKFTGNILLNNFKKQEELKTGKVD